MYNSEINKTGEKNMSFDFSAVKKGTRDHKKIIMLYGVPGIGKTTQCAALPNAFFLPIEDGTADLDVAQYTFEDGSVKLQAFGEVMGILDMLLEQGRESGFENIIIDSASALEPLIHRDVCAAGDDKGHIKANIEDFGYGGGYKRALKYWQEFYDKISLVRSELDVNVWLIGHSMIKTVSNPDNEPYDRYMPELHKDAIGLLQKNSDALIFAKFREIVRKIDGKMGAKENKAIGQGERFMYTSEMPAFLAKNRSQPSLPHELPFDCNSILDLWNKKD